MTVKHTSASEACAIVSLSQSSLYTVQTMRSAPVDTPTIKPSSAGGTCSKDQHFDFMKLVELVDRFRT